MSGSARSKYPLHLPASLKEAAARLARNDGVSLNQWSTADIAQKVGAVETANELLARRAAEANPGDLIRYLDAAPDVPPEPGDEVRGVKGSWPRSSHTVRMVDTSFPRDQGFAKSVQSHGCKQYGGVATMEPRFGFHR